MILSERDGERDATLVVLGMGGEREVEGTGRDVFELEGPCRGEARWGKTTEAGDGALDP